MGAAAVKSEQIRQFVDDGYLVVPKLIDDAKVDEIRVDAERFASGHYPVSNLPDEGRLLAIHFPHWVSDVALSTVHHEGIAAVVSAVAGAHLAHWDGRIKCMQSMLFLKPSGLQGQAWHQDERFIPTRDRSLIGAWIALDDATVENGCLWVLPGSHRPGVLYQTRDHGRPDEFDPTDEAYGFDASDAIPVEVQTGDVVFFNGYLLHRSLKNRSDRTRRALVNHYMSASSLLPWAVPGVNVATEDTRSIVMVVGDDPYPWKPIDEPPGKVFVRPHAGAWSAPDPLHVDTSIAIHAPIEQVWSVLVDTSAYSSWNPSCHSVTGTHEVGQRITMTRRPVGDEPAVSYDVDIIEVDPPRLLVREGGLVDREKFRGTHRWELTQDGAVTIVRNHERFSGTRAADIMAKKRDSVAADFDAFNEALKRACEAP